MAALQPWSTRGQWCAHIVRPRMITGSKERKPDHQGQRRKRNNPYRVSFQNRQKLFHAATLVAANKTR
jgi:hypothetical protein